MKRIIIAVLTATFCITAWGQAQINTKSVKISDFTQKTTKVVLTGNDFFDSSLKDEITAIWHISPYEFCTLEEFGTLKTDDRYYFLLTTKGKFKNEKEAGLQFFTLVKGGAAAEKGINKMLEIVSLPFAAAEEPNGREHVFLRAFLNIIQNFTLDAMEKDTNAYGGLGLYNIDIFKTKNMGIVFSKDDLSNGITQEIKDKYFDKDILAIDENYADSFMTDGQEGILVSYVVAPTNPGPGAFCYKMLIYSGSHRLYYFKKHRLSKNQGAGFLPEDIRVITLQRKNNGE